MSGPVSEDAFLMTIEEWRNSVKSGLFNEYDGSGEWVRDGQTMTDCIFDDVFNETPPEGATHVAWYNK